MPKGWVFNATLSLHLVANIYVPQEFFYSLTDDIFLYFLACCNFFIFQDDDPYVRKTAAICVAKLFDINAELVEDRGFLEALKDLISDNNPMVVANAVAALAEIQENSTSPIFEINSTILTKLLTALNECTE